MISDMYSISLQMLLLLLTTLIFQPFCSAQLQPQNFRGSLSDNWNFNLTFFTTDMDGILLYVADYEMNVLIVSSAKQFDTISVRFNKDTKSIGVKSLCHCQPCEEKMMNIYLNAIGKSIGISCNKFGPVDFISKVNIENRINKNLPKPIQDILVKNGEYNIYTSISLDKSGCLESLTYNDQRITFNDMQSHFLSACPRSCTIGDCNDGKCRAFDPNGPMCDCSSTALSGPFCNDSMIPYRQGQNNNSYFLINHSIDFYIKLAWKGRFFTENYCLLDFFDEYARVLITSRENFLLKGNEVLAQIDFNKINFIDINVTNKDVTIKVNGKPIQFRPALLGKLMLNVGFTKKEKECSIFDGTFHLQYNSSQLSRVLPTTTTVTPLSTIPQAYLIGPKFDIKMIIIVVGSILFTMIVFLVILLIAICIRRGHYSKDILMENIYDQGHRKATPRSNNLMSGDDPYQYDDLEYERLSPVRFNSLILRSPSSELPELPPRNSQC